MKFTLKQICLVGFGSTLISGCSSFGVNELAYPSLYHQKTPINQVTVKQDAAPLEKHSDDEKLLLIKQLKERVDALEKAAILNKQSSLPSQTTESTPAKTAPIQITADNSSNIALSASALFPYASSELSLAGRMSLVEFTLGLDEKFTDVDALKIVGYTDQLGDKKLNLKLSEARASSVKLYVNKLLGQRRVKPKTIQAQGMGDALPVVSCDTKSLNITELRACLEPNRRVEINVAGVTKISRNS